MFSAKMVALAMALWAGSEATRVQVSETYNNDQTHESDKGQNEAGSDVDVVQTRDNREGSEELSHTGFLPIDANPIGAGTIAGSHGLLVMVFGDNKKGNQQGIKIKDLKRIVLDRRFPDKYSYGAKLRSVERGRRITSMRDTRINAFVKAQFSHVNLIICPFLSTLMNEGALEMKQKHTRAELTKAVLDSGLDKDVAEAHVEDNFLNNRNGKDDEMEAEFDIWNLEGETDEHVTSTGINDCETKFRRCNNNNEKPPKQSCDTQTYRKCSIPNPTRFAEFVSAVIGKTKWDENAVIKIKDLDSAFP